MNRKQKKELRQRQSTRQLMGIVRVTPHGIVTDSGERVFFLIQPDNLSVLSPEVIRGRVRSLTMLLSTQPSLEILALDSRESFQRNKEYYLRRLEEETEPAVRELLERDMAHLDAIQFSSASSRKFVLVLPLDEKAGADESALRQLEKAICDHGLRVRLAEEQDVKRLLAIYYRQDLTTEVFRDFDGEEYVHGYKENKTEKESGRAGTASERLSGHDRARGAEVQHRPLHPWQPISHGDDTEKLPAHDG